MIKDIGLLMRLPIFNFLLFIFCINLYGAEEGGILESPDMIDTQQTRFFVSSASCNHVITQASIPALLTDPGIYCVAENLDGQGQVTIDIQGNDMILDLNGKQIRGGSANIRARNSSDVLIKNGFVQEATQTNVVVLDSRNIILSNVDISSSDTGVFIATSTQVSIQDINFRDHAREVIFMNGVNTAQITNCSFKFNRHTDTIFLVDSSNVTCRNVAATDKNANFNLPTEVNAIHGVQLVNCTFMDCMANDNVNNGTGNMNGFTFTNSSDIKCVNCSSSGNRSSGSAFGFSFTTPTSERIKFISCVANSNRGDGGDCCGFVLDGDDNLIEGCIADDNVSTTTCAGIHLQATSDRATVLRCITKNNFGLLQSVGIRNDSATSNIFNNISQSHATANFLGPAPIVTYNPALGAFTTTPEPFDNIDVM